MLKRAIRHTHVFRQSGDMFMDIETDTSWDDLVTQAQDRTAWKASEATETNSKRETVGSLRRGHKRKKERIKEISKRDPRP